MTVKELCEKYNPEKVFCYCNAPEGWDEDTMFYDMGYWKDGHLIAEDFYETDVVNEYKYDAELNRVTVVLDIEWRV